MPLRASTYPILIVLIVTGVAVKLVDADTNDNDYLRVSSNQFDGTALNYHSITPARVSGPTPKQVARASEDVVNHIGKPLVALPAKQTPTKQPSPQYIYRVPPTAVASKAAVSHNNNIQGQQRASLPPPLPTPPLLAWNSTVDPADQSAGQRGQLVAKKQDGLATFQQQPPATRKPKPRSTTSASPANSKRHVYPSYPLQQSLDAGTGAAAAVATATSTKPPPLSATNTCKWMQLGEFKDVSFETGRMVFVDDTDQPCYILTMRAFVRWNETLYFPLRNYRPHPRGSYKVSVRSPTDGAIGRLVLNCSMPEVSLSPSSAGATISLVPNQLAADYSFDEEITILVECGYLTLKLTGDDAHISLNSIAFHQNPDLVDERPKDKRRRYPDPMITNAKGGDRLVADDVQLSALKSPEESGPAGIAKDGPAVVLNKHQVFSTEAVHKAPLLIMPLISRFICQNRIVLNGSNLVQIVLERFELQRLITNPPTASSSSLPQPSITRRAYRQRTNPRASSLLVTEGNYNFNTDEDNSSNYNGASPGRGSELIPQEKVHSARLIKTSARIRRSPGDTTILYKRPLLAAMPLTLVSSSAEVPLPR